MMAPPSVRLVPVGRFRIVSGREDAATQSDTTFPRKNGYDLHGFPRAGIVTHESLVRPPSRQGSQTLPDASLVHTMHGRFHAKFRTARTGTVFRHSGW